MGMGVRGWGWKREGEWEIRDEEMRSEHLSLFTFHLLYSQ